MNQTLLALLCALSIYGLSNFVLPRTGWDAADDPHDIATSDEVPDAMRTPDAENDERGT
jgi:hypothetical protein